MIESIFDHFNYNCDRSNMHLSRRKSNLKKHVGYFDPTYFNLKYHFYGPIIVSILVPLF